MGRKTGPGEYFHGARTAPIFVTLAGPVTICPNTLVSIPILCPSIGRKKSTLTKIIMPYGSSRASDVLSGLGNTPTATLPPSRGGIGIRLKTARMTLIALIRFKRTQVPIPVGR